MYKKHWLFVLTTFLLGNSHTVMAQVLAEAVTEIKIPLVAKPTSRPMTVAYMPDYRRYYIADGGHSAMMNEMGIVASDSEVRAYSDKGVYLQVVKPNLDNRSIYYNPLSQRLESITYNVSSWAGFTPNTGIFALALDGSGGLTGDADTIMGQNPAFGCVGTIPSFDPAGNRYYAKQERSNKVLVVKPDSRDPVAEIDLDLDAAGVKNDDVSDGFAAYTGVAGEELALLDVDHKAILVFDRKGKFVGRSALPKGMKLRANNHYSGLGYTNGLFFVYHEPEGAFGTYYGFRFLDGAG